MTQDIPLVVIKMLLNVEYRTLYKLREKFPKKSNHKATVYIDSEMTRILNEIDSINQQVEKK